MSWMDKTGFPLIQISLSKDLLPKSYQESVTKVFLEKCSEYLEMSNNDGFGVSLKEIEYQWGSNGEVLNRGLCMLLASTINR
jgi:endoglucanase